MERRLLVGIVLLAVVGGAWWWLAAAVPEVTPATAETGKLLARQPVESPVERPVDEPSDEVPVRQVVTEPSHEESARYHTLGPLSANGKAVLLASLDRSVTDDLAQVVQRMVPRGGDEVRPDWSAVESALVDIDYERVRHEHVQRDLYLTTGLTVSARRPPLADGMNRCTVSPVHLEDETWGMVLIDVPVRPRLEAPPGLQRLLVMTGQEARTAWVQEFDAKGYEERRTWLDHWTELSARAEAGLAGLETPELVEWCAYHMLFEHTGITFDGSTAFAR